MLRSNRILHLKDSGQQERPSWEPKEPPYGKHKRGVSGSVVIHPIFQNQKIYARLSRKNTKYVSEISKRGVLSSVLLVYAFSA